MKVNFQALRYGRPKFFNKYTPQNQGTLKIV